jgi:hypothetical protein
MGTLVLDTTTKTIKVAMSGAAATSNPEFTVAYADSTSSSLTEGALDGALNGTSDVTVVSAPASSTRRVIKWITIENKDTASVTLTVKYDNNGTQRIIAKVTLDVGDTWTTDGTFSNTGALKTALSGVGSGTVTSVALSGGTTGLTVSGSPITTSGTITLAGTLAVANGGTGVTTSTGSGSVVLSTSPTLTTPVLGTPTSGTLSNCTVDGTNPVGYINAPQSTNTTLALTDQGKHVYFTGGSTATLSVPTNASVAFPTGTTILVVNNNSSTLTIQNATSGVSFQLANGASATSRTVATKGMATLLYVGSDTWYVSGAGVT